MAQALSAAAVCSSAGKKVSRARSESVRSTGVPTTVVVVMNDSVPDTAASLNGTATAGSATSAKVSAGAGSLLEYLGLRRATAAAT